LGNGRRAAQAAAEASVSVLKMRVIDYDEIEQWHPWLTAMVLPIAPAELLGMLKTLRPQDVLNCVVENIGRQRLAEYLNSELDRYFVSVYHGTRVTEAELRQIRTDGLRPLRLSERRAPLVAVFSQHPEWSSEKERLLDVQLHRFGPGWAKAGAGCREDGSVGTYACHALGCFWVAIITSPTALRSTSTSPRLYFPTAAVWNCSGVAAPQSW
jgi:hypothetical protein